MSSIESFHSIVSRFLSKQVGWQKAYRLLSTERFDILTVPLFHRIDSSLSISAPVELPISSFLSISENSLRIWPVGIQSSEDVLQLYAMIKRQQSPLKQSIIHG